jgi:hypothetical protein
MQMIEYDRVREAVEIAQPGGERRVDLEYARDPARRDGLNRRTRGRLPG